MKPILFNTSMVRAILDGEKTCTRRIIKKEIPEGYEPLGFVLYPTDDKELGNLVFAGKGANVYYAKPPYKVGDILYVRETWFKGDLLNDAEEIEKQGIVLYRADGIKNNNWDYDSIRWRPSIHMPKELARIFLKVTSVRAERLKDITDEGCLSEGIREFTKDGIVKKYDTEPNMHTWQEMPRTPKGAFEKLWNSTVNVKKVLGWLDKLI